MKRVLIAGVGVGLFATALMVFLWIVPRHDALVAHEEQVKKEWAQIEVMLQRRYDLIPSLVATTERFATDQEANIIKDVTDAAYGYRSADDVNGKIKASRRTEGAIKRLMVWGRMYPQLASSEHFLRLSASFEKTADLLSQTRMGYNDAVSELNTLQRSVSGRVANWVAGIPEYEYYRPDDIRVGDLELVRADGELRADSTAPSSRLEGAPQTPPDDKAAAADDGESDVGALQLKGVINVGSKGKAIIAYPDGRSEVFSVGDPVTGVNARLREVTRNGALLEVPKASGTGVELVRLHVD